MAVSKSEAFWSDKVAAMAKKPVHKRAVGINYGGDAPTPSLAVKGEDAMADIVVRLARRFNIPVVEKPELAAGLSALEVDQSIPEDLYEAVALLLAELDTKF